MGRGQRAALGLVRALGGKGSIIALGNAGRRVLSNDCGRCSGRRVSRVRGWKSWLMDIDKLTMDARVRTVDLSLIRYSNDIMKS